MRARSIKPGTFKNELLAVADPLYTLIFEGLWCFADREGRMEDRPAKIHMEINPGRTFEGTERAMAWLADNGFIQRYSVQGKAYILVVEFAKHQKPHQNEKPSVIPAPESTTKVASAVDQGAKHLALTPSSLNPDSGLLTPAGCALSESFETFAVKAYPQSVHRQDVITAIKSAQCLVGMGKVTEEDLRRRVMGFRAFADSGGYSGPDKVPAIQKWFQVHQQGEAYWAKEWAAIPSKAQKQQDENIDAGLRWLNQQGNA